MSILRGVCPSHASSLRTATLSRSSRATVTVRRVPAIVERPTGNYRDPTIKFQRYAFVISVRARHSSSFKFVSGSSRDTNLSNILRILGSQIAERDSDTRCQPRCRGQGRPPGQRGILIRRAQPLAGRRPQTQSRPGRAPNLSSPTAGSLSPGLRYNWC